MLHSHSQRARRAIVAAMAAVTLCGITHAQDDKAAAEGSIDAVLRDIEQEQAKLPRSRFSIAAVIAEIGQEASPAAMHAWVRKNTRAVDYAGSLRDVDGVLADRSGNSLDRSLLLARLLSQNGYDVKVVGVDKPSPAEAAQPQAIANAEAEQARAKSIAAELAKLVGPVKPNAAAPNRHWWVQYNDGSKWIDLDPAQANAGEKIANPAGAELIPDGRTQQIVVPAELRHSVVLSLQVERWENGKLLEASALRMTLDDPKEAALVSNRLTFQPFHPQLEKVVAREDSSSAKLREAMLAETAWCPVIVEGSTAGKLAKVFDDAGIVTKVPKGMGGAEEIAKAMRSGMGGMFGGLAGDPGGKPAEKPTVLTAVFADYTITSPGSTPRTIRRPVFDNLGPALRQAAANGPIERPKWSEDHRLSRGVQLNAIHSTLVARAALDFDTYVARYGQRVIDAKPLFQAAAKGPLDDKQASRLADLTSFNSLELFATQRATSLDGALYVGEPQIYRRIVALVPGAEEQPTLRATSDLAWNRLRTTGDTASLIQAGVADTLSEAAVVMARQEAPDQSTASLIEAATKSGATLKLLKTPDEVAAIELPADSAARIRADLAAGQWVVVPSAAVKVADAPRIGWWRIDPVSLQTVGAMDTGYLQATVEVTETHEVNGIMITKFGRLRIGPAARAWAEEVIKRRSQTSWSQWTNLLRMAQQAVNSTGRLPPL